MQTVDEDEMTRVLLHVRRQWVVDSLAQEFDDLVDEFRLFLAL